ncbi:MAG: cryptochrome/photolyase family protein [Alphaproteobacteria bacterium]|nr:cryptochrome/photolyase family protein [Alphaproteobacteria bacterium]OJV13567.1 MAG: cryptochrome/photolyase family protein [Alphaproteobacteria bacterium 33-17]
MSNLILILVDQLSHNISSLNNIQKDDIILIMETMQEATYVKHHKKKLVFTFAAMRHFAEELRNKGLNVEYIELEDAKNKQSYANNLERVDFTKFDKLIITHPGEYRILEEIESLKDKITIEIREDDRFLCSIDEFKKWSKGKKSLRMEYFYREMRNKHNVLMNQDKPLLDKWNFDAENRNKYDGKVKIPELPRFEITDITKKVIKMVEKNFANHFGEIESFYPAVTRKDALKALNYFIKTSLKYFGDYQDAMLNGEAFLFHSVLSPYINIGLLDPLEVIKAAEEGYYQKNLPINAVEGFIRQILGWREFMRGIYWSKMPEYANTNYFKAKANLPQFYWDGKTDMNCVSKAVDFTVRYAYSHHIQRLMVTGNLALIMGLEPKQVEEWYLLVYLDAYEWVELPNTHGMSLFADGGFLGSKPYAASGNYINKMSDFCGNCKYNVKENDTENACPFNYLYWNFMDRNKDKLSNNQRLTYVYSTLSKFSDEKLAKINKLALNFIKNHT